MTILAQAASEISVDAGAKVTLLMILLSATFTDNILLTRFLGMCPFLSVSRHFQSAFGLGLAVTFVTTFTCGLNAILYRYGILARNLPKSLQLILFIVVIAAFTQLMEMLIERISLKLYYSLGIFLPLITVNCAILGTSLFMVSKDFGIGQSFVYGFASGAGWMLAIILMAGIREKTKNAPIPAGLQGPGITLIIAGIMALAFIGYSGLIKM